jgi:hypothetical protein
MSQARRPSATARMDKAAPELADGVLAGGSDAR